MAAIVTGEFQRLYRAPDPIIKVVAFDILDGCLGTLKACQVAAAAFQAGQAQAALIVAAENAGLLANNGATEEYVRHMASAVLLRPTQSPRRGLGRVRHRAFPEYLSQSRLQASMVGPLTLKRQAPIHEMERVYLSCLRRTIYEEILSQDALGGSRVTLLPTYHSTEFYRRLKEIIPTEWMLVSPAGESQWCYTSSFAAGWSRYIQTEPRDDIAIFLHVGSGVEVAWAPYYRHEMQASKTPRECKTTTSALSATATISRN
jgi:hypothetical protein